MLDVRKARRIAQNAKTFVPCVLCLAQGNRCSEVRPCLSCVRSQSTCERSAPLSKRKSDTGCQQVVERPIVRSNRLGFFLEPPKDDVRCELEWAVAPLRMFMYSGIFVHASADSFASLSWLQRHEISSALNDAQLIASKYSPNIPPSGCSTTGHIKIQIDPGTGLRRSICSSGALSELIPMHSEEILSRLARFDLPPFTTDTDVLLLMLHRSMVMALAGHPAAVSEVYLRMRLRCGDAVRDALVCIATELVFENSKLTEVRRDFREVTPDAYDAATRRWPERCPLFFVGDCRSGRQLLADFEADSNHSLRADAVTAIRAARAAIIAAASGRGSSAGGRLSGISSSGLRLARLFASLRRRLPAMAARFRSLPPSPELEVGGASPGAAACYGQPVWAGGLDSAVRMVAAGSQPSSPSLAPAPGPALASVSPQSAPHTARQAWVATSLSPSASRAESAPGGPAAAAVSFGGGSPRGAWSPAAEVVADVGCGVSDDREWSRDSDTFATMAPGVGYTAAGATANPTELALHAAAVTATGVWEGLDPNAVDGTGDVAARVEVFGDPFRDDWPHWSHG